MNHGIATIKGELKGLSGDVVVKKGEQGIITAYLPEMSKFAVLFSEDRWYTFNENEEEFLDRFEVIKNEREI